MPQVVDTDKPETWPPDVLEWVRSTAEGQDPTGDLRVPPDGEDSFRELFAGHLVRAYHATRLLDHEVRAVREQGLCLLSPELARDRIEAARQHGNLSDREAEILLGTNVAGASNRAGQVCLFFDEQVMQDPWSGIWWLLTTWGGEAIYWRSESDEAMIKRLRSLGQPTLVVVGLDVSTRSGRHLFTPDLRRTFLSKFLAMGLKTGLHYYVPVPPDQILDIWRPGHPEYERRKTLVEAEEIAHAD